MATPERMPEPNTMEVTTQVRGRRQRRPELVAQRDRGTLIFIDGPTAGAIVALSPGDAVVLGRVATATTRIAEDNVSRRHAKVAWNGVAYVIEDLDSLTGTWLNGERTDRAALSAGDRVHLGPNVSFRFDLHDEREQTVFAELHEAAMRDALTGAYTRRYLHERLEAELSYAARHGLTLALVMLDLDHFKRVNDLHGHLAGDAVLRGVAARLRGMLRPEDVLVRYGGEELCLLLRGLDEGEACVLAERVRGAVKELAIRWNEHDLRVTLSAGVAATKERLLPSSPEQLIARADEAMYRSKELGRDRTCVHTGLQIAPVPPNDVPTNDHSRR